MPLVELGNGKTVEIPIEIYLDDKLYQDYIQLMLAKDMGFHTENFFMKAV